MREVLNVRLGGACVAALLACGATATASDTADDRATLAGITQMSVVVEGLAPAAERAGLTTMALQADVEGRLRKAGISIVGDADAYLYVHVTVADPGPSLPLPYYVEVAFMQEVTLPRGVRARTPIQSPTWSLARLGLSGADLLRTSIASRVDEFVDQFIRAYQAVNAK